MGKEALLIIDMLNDFVLEGSPLEVPETRRIIRNIRREIEGARKLGMPVIYVCISRMTWSSGNSGGMRTLSGKQRALIKTIKG